MLYDGLLLIALWFLVTAVFLAISGGQLAQTNRPGILMYALRFCLVLTTMVFYAGFWTHGGQTLGMRAWRLQLVNRAGGSVTWKQAIIRLLAAIPSLGFFGIGLFWVLFDSSQRAWHDRLSGTHLVLLAKKS